MSRKNRKINTVPEAGEGNQKTGVEEGNALSDFPVAALAFSVASLISFWFLGAGLILGIVAVIISKRELTERSTSDTVLSKRLRNLKKARLAGWIGIILSLTWSAYYFIWMFHDELYGVWKAVISWIGGIF